MLLGLLSQPVDEAPVAVASVNVAWSGVAPILILVGAALVLLAVDSLVTGKLRAGAYSAVTALAALVAMGSAVPLWSRVRDVDRGPFSTLGQAIGVDGFSVFATFAICAAVLLSALLLDDWLRREEMEGAEPYALISS
jgi:NADH:ubiquinone oxidoreductase subunit 2 (subunit N)